MSGTTNQACKVPAMQFDPIPIFASIALLQVLGWLSPGPNLVAISGASMSSGRSAGMATAAGVALGVGIWALLAVFGVSLLFEALPSLFLGLKLAGAGFLCWLGVQSLRAALNGNRGSLSANMVQQSIGGAFRNGFLVLMTNPKAPVFFGAILTSYLPLGAPGWILSGIVLEFLILSLVLNGITAVVFSTHRVMGWFERHQIAIRGGFGLVYLALGLLVLKDAVTG